jgi:hypothetical protein
VHLHLVGCQFTCLSLNLNVKKLKYRINKKGMLALAFKATPGKVNKTFFGVVTEARVLRLHRRRAFTK